MSEIEACKNCRLLFIRKFFVLHKWYIFGIQCHMATISLCMIVKNEQEVLGRCLDSIKSLVDEIIIVDTGSNDGTIEIAKRYTNRVYNFVWVDDFSLARNYSFSRATCDYVLWLDADDVLEGENIEAFRKLKSELNDGIDVVMMKYNIAFDDDKPTYSYFRERILKRSKNFRWQEPVHEVIVPSGNIIYSDVAISHRKQKPNEQGRNLRLYQIQLSQNKKLSARGQFYYARELYFNGHTDDAIVWFSKFLKNKRAWIENKIDAYLMLARCFEQKGIREKVIKNLLQALVISSPNAEICCGLGDWYLAAKLYSTAIFWYQAALSIDANELKYGFVNADYCGFIPCIQLCVCYFHINKVDLAKNYNEKAATFKPNHPSVFHNRKIFQTT